MLSKLFSSTCAFERAAVKPDDFPTTTLPEVAFAGRSNVGKSSLINAVVNRKALARTSRTPGRTQQIVFFNVADALMIADFPGHGFAQAPPAVIKQWHGLVDVYLRHRRQLRQVYVLIDSRRSITDDDRALMEQLTRHALSWYLVLTKVDKLGESELHDAQSRAQACVRGYGAARENILTTSVSKNLGIDDIREALLFLTSGHTRP